MSQDNQQDNNLKDDEPAVLPRTMGDEDKARKVRHTWWLGAAAVLLVAGTALAGVVVAQPVQEEDPLSRLALPGLVEQDKGQTGHSVSEQARLQQQVRALYRLKLRERLTPEGFGLLTGDLNAEHRRADWLLVLAAARAEELKPRPPGEQPEAPQGPAPELEPLPALDDVGSPYLTALPTLDSPTLGGEEVLPEAPEDTDAPGPEGVKASAELEEAAAPEGEQAPEGPEIALEEPEAEEEKAEEPEAEKVELTPQIVESLASGAQEEASGPQAIELTATEQAPTLLPEGDGEDVPAASASHEDPDEGEDTDMAPGGAPSQLDASVTALKGKLHMPLLKGHLANPFGEIKSRRSRAQMRHTGWTMRAPGSHRVRCASDGEAVYTGWLRGYGLVVIVEHQPDLHTVYAHLKQVHVRKGATVKRGQPVGQVGKTGTLDADKLYFELRHQGHPVDPEGWFVPAAQERTL